MRRTHTLVSDAHDELEVWVEPWADVYLVARGSKVTFSYNVEGEVDLLETEVAAGRMTLWLNGSQAPEVTVDGKETMPIDQYEWHAERRRRGPK